MVGVDECRNTANCSRTECKKKGTHRLQMTMTTAKTNPIIKDSHSETKLRKNTKLPSTTRILKTGNKKREIQTVTSHVFGCVKKKKT